MYYYSTKAVKTYMSLNGKERFALQVMLGVEKLPQRKAYNQCMEYLEKA